MSEDKPTFKVTDRRLFNPDGSPRDIEREEPAATVASDEATTVAPSSNANAQPATADTSATSTAPRDEREVMSTSSAPDTSASERSERNEGARPPDVEGRRTVEDRPGAEEQRAGASQASAEADPTPFANLVMFIASPAAAAMGMTEHPGLQPGELDLPLARHCIDLLATVREKSRGNLGAQEQQIIESLLAELQMQYVSLTSARRPAPPPRGFTGGDITGGR
ncbi:MAG: hypothetical protein QOE33_2361 [Acidobacteriota bacterium]|nr:hypothetical protein [Acidobacteriota bacterium]